MRSKRWQEIKALLGQASELPDGERDAFLREQCAGDDDLLSQVLGLLSVESRTHGFLEPPGSEEIEGSMRLLSLDLVGKTIGDFELISELGRGAVGVVYLAVQAKTGRRVAVKVLAPHFSLAGERLERFRREALAGESLEHPNIVSLLCVGVHEGLPYLAMEYVDGKSLAEHIEAAKARREGRIEGPSSGSVLDVSIPRVAAALMAKVARALHHCHEKGIIHRDVKPTNILIGQDGEPRVADFSLARNDSLSTLTETGTIAGTPYYMSPEQATARGAKVDHRTDIYSSGAVLYELLTLDHPFQGESALAVLKSICQEEPRSIRKLVSSVPEPLERICRKAMEKRPRDRYPSAAELGADLGRFLEGKRVHGRPSSKLRSNAGRVLEHPRLATAGLFAVLFSVAAGVQISRSILYRSEVRAQEMLEEDGPFKLGIPAQAVERMSRAELLEQRRLYNDYLLNTLSDEPTK